MKQLQISTSNYCKPRFGLKYEHLNEEEMLYITECNNCDSKTRYIRIRSFYLAHKDLKEFEDRIKDGEGLNLKYDYPSFYIAHLVSYGRITIPYKAMIKVLSHTYKELNYEGSPFVNTEFLDEFKKESEMLKYCNTIIESDLRELIAISIFFKVNTTEIPNMFDKYINLCNENNMYKGFKVSSIYNIFSSMGYNLLESGITLNAHTSQQYISKNMSQQFLDGLEEYIKWYSGRVGAKTVKCVRSHIMAFLNYMADTFSDIERLCYIENNHILLFIKFQLTSKNYCGNTNSAGSINARNEAISGIWEFFIKEKIYKITSNIVTIYDKLKEPKKFAVYISKEEILKLINALKNIEGGKFMQLKYIIIILLHTGRRIHEVLALEFKCIKPINGKKYIYFYKFKQDKQPRNIPIGEECEVAVLKLQEMVANFKRPLKSKHDNRKVRRLFPSIKNKGSCTLDEKSVECLFHDFQILNNIVNIEGKPVFNIHDIKRTFVSNMLALGYNAIQISEFLKQNVNSLLPYESNNEAALQALKLAEEKGLLIGNRFANECDEGKQDSNQLKTRIIELLKNTGIANRHTENLIYKLKNPQDSVPLFFGECTDKDSILVCGTLICMACDEILLDNIESCEVFFMKIYKYIYKNKRNKETKAIEEKLKIVCENIYINKEKMSEIEMKRRINSIKKQARQNVLCN